MRQYFTRMEANHYLLPFAKGHGYEGWLSTQFAPIDIVLKDPQLLSLVSGAAFALANETNLVINIGSLLIGDANSEGKSRDTTPGLYQIPISDE